MKEITIQEDVAIGLIPARGGSKSIPLKNIISLAGRPMISYVIQAGKGAKTLSQIYCSTDHDKIAAVCNDAGIEVIERPEYLAQDDTPVTDVIRHVLETLGERNGVIPGMVALLQPTSPFLLPEQVDECVEALKNDIMADSSQTVTRVIHNFHAFNQRIVDKGYVQFRFLEERKAAYNKQRKPKYFVFGNLVVTRSRALLDGLDCFGNLSVPIEISRKYALDVDTREDVDYASFLLDSGKVRLVGS